MHDVQKMYKENGLDMDMELSKEESDIQGLMRPENNDAEARQCEVENEAEKKPRNSWEADAKNSVYFQPMNLLQEQVRAFIWRKQANGHDTSLA